MDTIPKKCYDNVRNQRDEAEVKIVQLVGIIADQCYIHLPEHVKESIRIQLIEMGL